MNESNLEKEMSKVDNTLGEELVKEVLQSGVDLRSYSKEVEKSLVDIENASVNDYIKQSEAITSLHQQIVSSDQILERLEGMLCAFQADLGNICQEILSLQELSVSLNQRLKNKQTIRSNLSQFVDDMIVSEAVISHILDTPVSEKEFLEQLYVLDHKICFVKEQSFREAKSCTDVLQILNNLKIKAITKIREYCLKKIHSCRKAMTNYQIPQNALLKNKFFYQFLMTHDREVAREIQTEYMDTMSKVYFSYFKEYLHRLTKLHFEEMPDKDDLMGCEDTGAKSRSSIFTHKHSLKNRSTVFSIGDRENLLTMELESPLIVPHVAVKSDIRYSVESLFRSHQFALVDNACREYLFITEVFMANHNTAQEFFTIVLGKTFSLMIKHIEDQFQNSYDTIALFVCLHIIYRYRLLAHKRAVPTLDFYWETIVKIIWPRFDYVFQLHIQSIRQCDTSKLTNFDTRPHYITRRYAEFSASIMIINDTFPDERVSILLGSLQNEVENLILKMASLFHNPKEQLIFIINNYDMILEILIQRKKEDSKESENIKQQLTKRIQDFVEELLCPHFGAMIAFVKDCESYIDKNDLDALKRQESNVTDLIKSFNSGWRKALEEISREVMNCFTNFKNGNNIQQSALTQIIQYYHRFSKIVSQSPFKNNPTRSELINIHQLMVEVKKYKTNF
ncbi:vacuolar protein sorting-associated protein 52 homolog [Oppia nitens]|uniref:vacuolar protein sorting-associated protein 52 homolog n=1 Tax=Oppia nitens TaxID=1686743 RepID=UPI0023DA547D|nr:vacuolar protein sorting-associated protein 52 homolog [Oppia nitens]